MLMAKLRLAGDFDYAFLAKSTPGYVGADLSALTGAAGVIAVKRIFEQMGVEAPAVVETSAEEGALNLLATEEMMVDEDTPISTAPGTPAAEDLPTPPTAAPANADVKDANALTIPFSTLPPSLASLPIATFLQDHPNALTSDQLESLSLTNADFTQALTVVQPSSQREGFTTVPDVTWDDLGALQAIREEMRMSIVRPIRRPDVFAMLGIQAPCGVLLWGPPGCGKTLLAKAVANESRANFISVKGPELLNKVRRGVHSARLSGIADDIVLCSTSEKVNELYDKCLLVLELPRRASSSLMNWTPWFLVATTLLYVQDCASGFPSKHLLFFLSSSPNRRPALSTLCSLSSTDWSLASKCL